jgi:hypothetical protein
MMREATMNSIVTSRSLARSVDGVYRDSSSSLVRAQLTRGLLPDDGLSSFSESIHDAFESGEVSSYERAARLYSETARKTTNQKSNTFVVIVSLCVASIPATIWASL